MNITKTNITFILYAEEYNNSCMRINGNVLIPGINTFIINTTLPTNIELVLSNKEKNETLINNNGDIIKDKHIELRELIVDNMPIPSWILPKICKVVTNDHVEYTNYWGNNSTINISFNNNNSLQWHLTTIANFSMKE